jgi:hypothetical protein
MTFWDMAPFKLPGTLYHTSDDLKSIRLLLSNSGHPLHALPKMGQRRLSEQQQRRSQIPGLADYASSGCRGRFPHLAGDVRIP